MRITKSHLEAKVDSINLMLGFESVQWDTVGAIRLYGAYGGIGVHRVMNTSGGVTDLMGGVGTAREASRFLDGMVAAFRLYTEQKV